MKSRVVRIGNSKGIRIPKPLFEQTGIADEVEIEVSGNTLVIRPAHPPRAGWECAFQAMAAAGEDSLLDPGAIGTSQWDDEDWEW